MILKPGSRLLFITPKCLVLSLSMGIFWIGKPFVMSMPSMDLIGD